MTLGEATSLCFARGFKLHDHVEHFGQVIPYVAYLNKGFHYVSLTSYEGRFVEGVYEVYLTVKNTRAKGNPKREEAEKRGFLPKSATIFRSLHELEKLLDSTGQV